MIWRDRVQAARERGDFSADDLLDWMSAMTCPAGEAALVNGLPLHQQAANYNDGGPDGHRAGQCQHFGAGCLWLIGDRMSDLMNTRDFDGADRLLDLIDDRALEIKRERSAG